MRNSPPGIARANLVPLRRLAFVGVAMLVVLLNCGREPTAPQDAPVRIARGLSFSTVFPEMAKLTGAAANLVSFVSVHIVLNRLDGTVAVDTTINFPADSNSVTVALNVRLSAGAPATGEPLMLEMSYVNAAGVTVFHAGPVQILAVPSIAGQPAPAPITVQAVYTGPGATAKSVRISPRTLTVNAGAQFGFTAVALDAAGATVPNTPIVWTSLDPTRATIAASTAGSGVALNSRGTARVVAQLLTLQADTALLTVSLPATTISAISGSGQTGIVGKPTPQALPQPLIVKIAAADGTGVSGQAVTFAVASGGGSISPATATTDASGLAQASWSLGSAGTQTATATAASLAGSPLTFSATGQTLPAVKLALTTAPTAGGTVATGSPIPLVVSVQDKDNDAVTGFVGNVSVALTTNPTSAVLAGTMTVAAVKGVAAFTDVAVPTPGTGYVLTASSTGLTGVSTPAFNVITGAAANLVLLSGGLQSAAPATALAPIIVLVTDIIGNAKAGVDVDFAVSSGGGTVTPAKVVSDALGKATATWTLGSVAGTQTMSATVQGVKPLSISATATSTTNTLVFTQQPAATQTAGVALSPAIVVEMRDPANQVVTSFTGAVTVILQSNPGLSTLGGTASVNAVAGVATFSTLTLNKVGTGYTLTANAAGATAATTTPFNLQAGAASALALVSGNNQVGTASAALSQPVVVQVTDALGNAVPGATVTFAITAGGGTVGTATATTNAAGQASSTWTLGATGTQTMSVSSGSLSGSPIAVTATIGSSSAVVSTTVSPKVDTLTSIGDTRQLNAQARDATGNLVAGNWTWVSRSPLFVTVSATGLVTSVVDGTSWIVATETGGTKDSAQITTQQRIASINVTPSSRSLYTGGLGTFSAQAVDGRGVAMATQPTFAWSSTAPAVASVNASTGAAAALSIGFTQIKATAGASVGVANLTVLSPISRIDVTFDSTNAPAPDNFTMTALGQTRAYRAIARDTLGVVMTGITFTWSSTNPSVAAVATTTTFQATATSSANGVTTIRATAQGVVGGATLNVAQVLSSIDLQPTSVTIGVRGQSTLLARGKDANGRFISGGSFVFSTSAPTIATVTPSTGVVTGVAIGPASITAANGAITSNAAAVTVILNGPQLISFGRDTLGIGRSSSLSIPVFLSTPNPTGGTVTVSLSVRDTIAFFSTASVTIPAGQTSANVTLNGKNAGATLVYAVDGGGTGYAPDTAVLNVQATVKLTTTFYSVNATDQVATQVLLSDPSPPSGTYVTFNYGTANIAQVSPDPAFIPVGQLASNIVIRGLAAGRTTITPGAAGVTGTSSSVNVGAAILSFSTNSTIRLGTGQFEANQYVILPNSLNNPLTVSLRSLDTTVIAVRATVIIPAGTSYSYFTATAKTTGSTSVIASSTGWQPDTLNFGVSTPQVIICCGTQLNSTSGVRNFTTYVVDSVFKNQHPRVNSLAVRVSSSNSSVITVLDTLVTIAAGQSYNGTGRVTPGGTGGTAYVKVTASGHAPDSTLYTVVGPAITFSWLTNNLGAGLENPNYYVQIPNALSSALAITLANSDSSKAAAPATVTIPQGQTYTYFLLRGKAVGTSTFIASAVGYAPDTATTIVNTPKISLNGGGNISAYSQTSAYVYVKDATGSFQYSTAPLTIRYSSTDTAVLQVDSIATIPAGGGYTNPPAVMKSLGGTAVATAKIIATAPGYAPDTATWTVQPAKLNLSFFSFVIGARQYRPANSFYVSTNGGRPVAVPVTLTQKNATVVALSTRSTTIPINGNFAYFTFGGLTAGSDTIIASAAGYQPDTAFVTVSTPYLKQYGMPSTANTTSPAATINIYAADSTGNTQHYASDTVVVKAVSSDINVITPSQPYFRIVKDAYYASTQIVYVGAGTATMTYSDSANSGYRPTTTNSVTVTGPSLQIGGSANGMLGMRQRTSANSYYVYTPNPVVGSPLTVNLVSTSTRVATVTSSVTIPVGQQIGYFTITGIDTIGTIQIQATASGYAPTSINMQVTKPKILLYASSQMNTTSAPSGITLYTADQNGSIHENVEDVTLTLVSSAPGVATLDSTTVTIKAGVYYHQGVKVSPVSVGSTVLSATDPRLPYYAYTAGTATVNVITPTAYLSFGSLTLGVGQYTDSYYLQVPDTRTTALTTALGHSAVPHTNTPAGVTIPVGQNYSYFRIAGTSVGLDTIKAAPAGHVPAQGVVNVGVGRIDPISGWPVSVKAGDSVQVTLYARDQQQGIHYVTAATTFALAATNIEFVSGGLQSAVITSATIAADAQYVQFWIRGKTAGTGSASITNSTYTSYSNSLTVTP